MYKNIYPDHTNNSIAFVKENLMREPIHFSNTKFLHVKNVH